MKVLHVAETIKGGVATVLDQLIDDNRIDSYCLIPDNHVSELTNLKNFSVFKRTGRNLTSLLSFTFNFIVCIFKFKPDIVHLHSSFAGAICRFLLFFWIKKPKIVYCPHAFSFLMDVSIFKKYIYGFIEWVLQFQTDIIICTSNFEKEQGLKYKLPIAKLCVIYNSVNAPFDDEISKDLNCESDCINILFVGRFDKQKGIDILLNISERLPLNYKFILVGDFVVNNKDYIFFPNNVEKIGWLNKKELSNYYKKSDLLFMPSRWESFGLVAVEAHSYGLPVMASNCSSLPEIVTHNLNGYLFDKNKLEDILNIFYTLKKDKLFAMRENCLNNYKKNFSTKTMQDKTFSMYERIL